MDPIAELQSKPSCTHTVHLVTESIRKKSECLSAFSNNLRLSSHSKPRHLLAIYSTSGSIPLFLSQLRDLNFPRHIIQEAPPSRRAARTLRLRSSLQQCRLPNVQDRIGGKTSYDTESNLLVASDGGRPSACCTGLPAPPPRCFPCRYGFLS